MKKKKKKTTKKKKERKKKRKKKTYNMNQSSHLPRTIVMRHAQIIIMFSPFLFCCSSHSNGKDPDEL